MGSALAADDVDSFTAGNVLVRARALGVLPDVSSKVDVIGGKADITDNYVPEVDGTYFLTPNIGFELIAAITYHDVKDKGSIAGDIPLGSVRLLPPTLTAQWHFLPAQKINPYVGAGINYTFFYGVERSPLPIIHSTHYSDNVGAALQAGADYNVSGRWYLNVDVKKIYLSTDVKLGTTLGPITAKADIDPWLVGLGVAYRF